MLLGHPDLLNAQIFTSNVAGVSGIDCEEARNEEERLMLKDAREWVAAGEVREELHSKTRASALHVAAAKGYIKVME